jgi:hypothetical protein
MRPVSTRRKILRRGDGGQLVVLRWRDLLFWLRGAGPQPPSGVRVRRGSARRSAPPGRQSTVALPPRCGPAIRERDRPGDPPTVHPAASVSKPAVHGAATLAAAALPATPFAHGAASSRRWSAKLKYRSDPTTT